LNRSISNHPVISLDSNIDRERLPGGKSWGMLGEGWPGNAPGREVLDGAEPTIPGGEVNAHATI
jgi:hypothetical protein